MLRLNCYIKSFYTDIILNQNKITILSQLLVDSSVMKNIVVLLGSSRFPVKLICCIAFQSESSVC